MTTPVPAAPVPTPAEVAPQVTPAAPVEPAPVAVPAPVATPAPTPGATPEYPEGLGDPGKKALDAEREARATAEKALKEFQDKAAADAKKIADEKLSELERAQNLASEKATAAMEKEAENLRLRFAITNSVPAVWIDRLKGATPEELAADWATIQPTLAPAVPPVPPVDPNAPRVPAPVPSQGPQPGRPMTPEELLYEQFHPQSN
ncbi:hypothetical protein CH305_18445 [Rhodococcus sp. 15-649-2-2]|uniref:hypothetical protein n=1 Tax=Rhodococcus sp. 15-649-2-2 TaxID=2023140 RepID=UPI000B9BABC5|nr:hypothetical protein [Rhodococcus sp. 15-649-2-2]OZE77217.1 hypothetical protein CH305_18445 [Rhodococcus sp. 15-649-2-2]